MPDRTRHLAFGDVAAAWGMLEDLGVAGIIDEAAGARRSDAGATAGTYLVLAALNRLVAPCSKAAFADWWKTTASDRFTSKINLTRKLGLEVSASKLIQIMSHVTSTSVPARDTQTSAGVGQLPVGRSRDCLLVQVRIPRRHDGWREPARGLLSALRGIDAPGRLDQLRKVVW